MPAEQVDPASLDADGLVAAAKEIERAREQSLAMSGRVLAELHDRCGMSWPQVEDGRRAYPARRPTGGLSRSCGR